MKGFALITAGILLPLSTLAAVSQSSATNSYLELHKKELLATNYNDIRALRSQTSIAHDKPMSREEVNFLFPLFKASLPRQVNVISEKVNGTSAILEATGKSFAASNRSEKTTGIIELTLENGQWKIEREKWDSKVVMK